jgi:hypothetical protein
MTSYQRRLRNIEFYKLRGRQLEGIIDSLCGQIRSLGHEVRIPLSGIGIKGDDAITDISSGDFGMNLMNKWCN